MSRTVTKFNESLELTVVGKMCAKKYRTTNDTNVQKAGYVSIGHTLSYRTHTHTHTTEASFYYLLK